MTTANFGEMTVKAPQRSCLFCVDSSKGMKKFKIGEEYGKGNKIRYDLTDFLGCQVESYLKDDDVLCCSCMNFFQQMANTKRRFIKFLEDRDKTDEVKIKRFNSIWKGFTEFANNLVETEPDD